MVFRGTITIEWNGWRQPLETMVFRWFLGEATIGNERWFSMVVHDWSDNGMDRYHRPSLIAYKIYIYSRLLDHQTKDTKHSIAANKVADNQVVN